MDLLEQLIFNNYAVKEFELLNGKLKFTIKTLTGDDQLQIDEFMSNLQGSTGKIMHTYTLRLLSHALLRYNDVDLTKLPGKSDDTQADRVFTYLKGLSGIILDKIVQSQGELEKECKELISPENIENLSETPPVNSDSN